MFDLIVRWLMATWQFSCMAAFLVGYLNIPILVLFLVHRVDQLGDKHFDRRGTLPTHAALHYYCAIHFGFIMPAWYFLTVRRHPILADEWWLGRGTNTSWTILLGAVCMGWLAWRLLGAALSGRRVKFGGRLDRIVAMLALALCLRFHLKTILATVDRPLSMRGGGIGLVSNWFMDFAYPQSHFLGATLAYGLAAAEAWREPAVAVATRTSRWAAAIALAMIFILFFPFLLVIPKHNHNQAMAVLNEHRQTLMETAEAAELDPRLLAGIAYVSHRHHVPLVLRKLKLDEGVKTGQLMPIMVTRNLMNLGPRQANEIETVWMDREFQAPSAFSSLVNYLSVSPINIRGPGALTDKRSIACATLMMLLLDDDWKKAGHSIDDRPEILATLYQIGFKNSHPKPDPKPNKFGTRVKEFMESDACRGWLEGVEK